ncbi:MAG: tRNA (adenosine(37)-N6)-dimethylallyltransferase MiaA [Proteobacteria bacterium]|nr:tRNA (adenosine(37)-N6)-dimethylallyltransferase MiaA [Pseudomonadota bacterium]
MTQGLPRVIVVAGPTATGKTDLALALAGEFAGIVINADSQQRYHDFPILTAQPAPADRARIPHRLFGDLAANDVGNAVEWAAKAAADIRAAQDQRLLPIVVGGTGLYLRVLMQGVADVPPIPDEIREAGRALLADRGNAAFHRLLAARDPISAARIPVGNTQRLARAWEVVEATGTPLPVWQEAPTQPAVRAAFFSVLIMPPREEIVAACAARFAGMMDAGALGEVEAALAKGVSETAPAMNALGARELADYLAGRLDRDGAVRGAEIATRQYAKRQATWFRNQFDADVTLGARYADAMRGDIVRQVGAFLKGSP